MRTGLPGRGASVSRSTSDKSAKEAGCKANAAPHLG
jgi:hypothetical protein